LALMSEWIRTTVGAVARKITKGTTPTSIGGHFSSSGIAFVKVESIKDDGRFDQGRFAFVDGNTNQLLSRSVLEQDDILFTIAGTIGRTALVTRQILPANTNQAVAIVRPNPQVINPRYLYYFLKDAPQRIHANSRVVQSVQANFSLAELSAIELELPPMPEQLAIAHILGTLDDRIELNRRMSENLEAMAHALFKSWFVDFDPVRAKAKGRDPSLPQPLADLFPDRLVDSELGSIPEGWEIKPLSQCVNVVRGISYKGSGLASTGMPLHNLNSIHEGGGYKRDGIKHYHGAFMPQHVLRGGDLIVANTEQGHHRRLIGYAAIVPAKVGGEGLFSHHIYRVRPVTESWLTADYLCHLLNTQVMHDIVSGFANGTTVNMLPIAGLLSPLVLVPPSSIVSMFDGVARQARVRHEGMIGESETLGALRDALLPKLVSGEIRIRDAERFTATAS
jgi:type I restriction enzyme S subunit